MLFFNVRFLVAPPPPFFFISINHCIVCTSLVYGFSLPLQQLLFIVLFVILLFTASRCLFCIFQSLYCMLFFSLRFVVASLVSFSHCIVCYSFVYGFSLPLQYLLVIVLYVILQFTVSRCLFSSFYSLYCLLFFCLRLLVASLVYFSDCIVCYSLVYGLSLPLQYLLFIVLYVIPLFTFLVASLVSFIHCILCYSFVYGFSLPLQYILFIVLYAILLFTVSRCLFSIFYSLYCMLFFCLRFPVASLVYFIHCIVCYSFVYTSRCLFCIFQSQYCMLFFN